MMIGVLGGGQLGRMLALAGYPLGLTCRFLDPDANAPAGLVAECVRGEFDDFSLVDHCFRDAAVVTYETENVPVAVVRRLAQRVSVFPQPHALAIMQDRLREKQLFQALDIPTPAFVAVQARQELNPAIQRLGLPCVLKTRRFGYDGKGQFVLRRPDDADRAWHELGGVPLLVEELVTWDREVSLVAVRGLRGHVAYYPLAENTHAAGILRHTLVPAPGVALALQSEAEMHVRRIVEHLDYVGVLAVEFFLRGDKLLANETAPRVHNSGHWSIDGAATSQFENHLRAIAGLPLGPTTPFGHAAMVNLIGVPLRREQMLAVPGAHLHWYGKRPRPGRKVGHVTLQHADPHVLAERLALLFTYLTQPPRAVTGPELVIRERRQSDELQPDGADAGWL